MNRSGFGSIALPKRVAYPDPRALLHPDDIAAPEAFAERVSILQLGTTCKTTKPGRHRLSDAVLMRALDGKSPVVLDVGASDGSTSLDLIAALGDRFSGYWVTDKSPSIRARQGAGGRVYFYDGSGVCILIATPRWLVYPEAKPSNPRLRSLIVRLSGGVPPFDPGLPEVALIQPRLRAMALRDPRVHLRSYDIFQPWDGPRPTVVKAANLLNRAYFPDDRIALALRNLWHALEEGGLLLVVDNRDVERSSLFVREARGYRQIDAVNGGTEIAALVLGA